MEATQATSIAKSLMCEDILLSVLCLLPPEVSARFKLVCSYWNRLISTSIYLQSLHKCCADSKCVTGFYHGSKIIETLQFGVLRCEDNDMHIVSSGVESSGLDDERYSNRICATCNEFILLRYFTKFILRNMLTKADVRILPLPHSYCFRLETQLIYTGLDVSSSSSSSSSSKQGNNIKLVFTIMNIHISRELGSSICSIYSSLSGSWKIHEMGDLVFKQLSSPQKSYPDLLRDALDPYPSLNPVGATILRRSLHWLFDDGLIFAFDLKKKIWRFMDTPAAQGGKRKELGLVKNYSDIISATIESIPPERSFELQSKVELLNKVSCYLYPNVWLGSLGEHIYLLLVIDETNLQLWMLDNYDEAEWRIIVDIKDCGFVAPVLFDGRRIFVAAFDFEEWKNGKGVITFFDIFTRKWLPTNLIIPDTLDQYRYFFAMLGPQ